MLNACINKDYASNTPIQIRVYEDKLEIINSGILPDNWTVDTLLASHGNYPYNPSIANTFFRAGEIEAWGRGIERIIMVCRQDGFSTPEFRCDASGIWTTFKFKYPERTAINISEPTPKTTQKPTQKTLETEVQKQEAAIIQLIKENPYITRIAIVSHLNLHDSSVKRRLTALQEKGVIKHIGPSRGGYWEIKKS